MRWVAKHGVTNARMAKIADAIRPKVTACSAALPPCGAKRSTRGIAWLNIVFKYTGRAGANCCNLRRNAGANELVSAHAGGFDPEVITRLLRPFGFKFVES